MLHSNKGWLARAPSSPTEKKNTGMLQTSLRISDVVRRFNVPHTTILWFRHRPQEIETTWNYPRSGLHPGTAPWKDWYIRLKHVWDQWRPSTRTLAETPGRHIARISTQTMHNYLRRLSLRVRWPYWSPILNRHQCAARRHQVMVQRLSFLSLSHTGFL